MAKRGRPPISETDVAAWKTLYLDLLSKGHTEIDIDEVSGMPCWYTRYQWKQNDADFSTRRTAAQHRGIEHDLHDAKQKLKYAFDRAVDDAASPQLVTIADKIAAHARWKAVRLNKDDYGDKTDVTTNGKELKGVTIVVGSQADKDILDKI